MTLKKLRRVIVVQRVNLTRGYAWLNAPMLGVIFVSAIKGIVPSWVDTFWKFTLFSLLGLVVMYIVGYLDMRLRFLHEEQDYLVETNPHLMGIVDGMKKPKGISNEDLPTN